MGDRLMCTAMNAKWSTWDPGFCEINKEDKESNKTIKWRRKEGRV